MSATPDDEPVDRLLTEFFRHEYRAAMARPWDEVTPARPRAVAGHIALAAGGAILAATCWLLSAPVPQRLPGAEPFRVHDATAARPTAKVP